MLIIEELRLLRTDLYEDFGAPNYNYYLWLGNGVVVLETLRATVITNFDNNGRYNESLTGFQC